MNHTSTQPEAAHGVTEDPGTGVGAKASTAPAAAQPMATITMLVFPDRIFLSGSLEFGRSTRRVMRHWDRITPGTWRTNDPEFIAAEGRIGLELAEFLDGIDLPHKVADMLPRPPAPGSTAAADAAQEVARD